MRICAVRFPRPQSAGWDMTDLLSELAQSLLAQVHLDSELIALDGNGRPDFHLLGSRMLHRRAGIDVTLFVFDVLAVVGHPTTMNAYADRRSLLEALDVRSLGVDPEPPA